MRGTLYLPGLNTLRLYAALSVVIGHLPDRALGFEMESGSGLQGLTLTGHDAVTLFFVLSGYLITYLLLDEQRGTGSIAVHSFYWRRGLRIWPLYFIIVATTLILLPEYAPSSPQAYAALWVFSGHVIAAFASLGLLSHLWSIGVEEWFYAIWPILMRRYSVPVLALGIIGARLLLTALLLPDAFKFAPYPPNPLLELWEFVRFESMALGAFGAWMAFNRHWALRIIYRLDRLIVLLFVLIAALFEFGGVVYDLVASLVFAGLILNISTNPRSLLQLEHPIVRTLGQWTYGVYMWHVLVSVGVGAMLSEWLPQPTAIGDVILTLTVIATTLAVSAASYRFVEAPFLRLKYVGIEPTPVIQ